MGTSCRLVLWLGADYEHEEPGLAVPTLLLVVM
jgi:hypothetical protein